MFHFAGAGFEKLRFLDLKSVLSTLALVIAIFHIGLVFDDNILQFLA